MCIAMGIVIFKNNDIVEIFVIMVSDYLLHLLKIFVNLKHNHVKWLINWRNFTSNANHFN